MNYALFTGTGASLGVPIIGCKCDVCTSSNPKNKRTRSSLYLFWEGKKVVIDTGPDFRDQALRFHIDSIDGVIYTHAHHDHTAGIDDLRVYYFKDKNPLPCLVSQATAKDLQTRYFFIFQGGQIENPQGDKIKLQVLKSKEGREDFLGIPIRYFTYEQLGMEVLGIRIGTFAYVTDIKKYDEKLLQDLIGVETLVVSALRFSSSHMHLTVDEAIDFSKKVQPKQTWLTHLSHELDHEKTNVYLPASIQLAYDGLQISI